MKNRPTLWLLTLGLVITIQGFGQAVISADKNNFLYAGIENPISIAVPNIDANTIFITATNGTLKRIDNVHYSIIPKFGNTSIHVFSAAKGDTTDHGSIAFRVLQIPAPNLFLGNLNLSENQKPTVDRKNLLATQALTLRHSDGFAYDLTTGTISGFNITYTKENELVSQTITGNRIPIPLIRKLQDLPEGSEVKIDNIEVNKQPSAFKGAYILQ